MQAELYPGVQTIPSEIFLHLLSLLYFGTASISGDLMARMKLSSSKLVTLGGAGKTPLSQQFQDLLQLAHLGDWFTSEPIAVSQRKGKL